MGSYFTLEIRGYDLISSSSYLEPQIGILFVESERAVSTNESGYQEYFYRSTTGQILRRLSIWGFTPERATEEFEVHRKRTIEDRTDEGEFWGDAVLHDLTIDKWCESVFKIIKNKSYHWDREQTKEPIERFILEDEDFLLGFPANDFRYMLATVLARIDHDEPVTLDYSELVHGGYYQPDARMVELSRAILREEKLTNEHIVILTEGTFDCFALEETLMLLYPDLVDSFSFLDFENSRTPGGAGQLVNYVKALTGAQIADRILAVFDNDSAARDATKQLQASQLKTPNINYIHCPGYNFLAKYPTIGPNGTAVQNINRVAGSIELYLGRDVLRQGNGFVPIQWTGFVRGTRTYQGELADKTVVQKRFKDKIQSCKKTPSKTEEYDWEGVRVIWQAIFDQCAKNAV